MLINYSFAILLGSTLIPLIDQHMQLMEQLLKIMVEKEWHH